MKKSEAAPRPAGPADSTEPPRRPGEPRGAQDAWTWKLEPPGPALGEYFTGPQRP